MFTQTVRAQFSRIVSVAVLAMLVAAGRNTAEGQPVFLDPVDVALGPPDATVLESDLAVGPDSAIALYICNGDTTVGGQAICYAVYDRAAGTWTESAVPIPPSELPPDGRASDPVVAYNRFSDSFVAVALEFIGGITHLVVSRFDGRKFERWRVVPQAGSFLDKPWIEAGVGDEFYITVLDITPLEMLYGRSTDGGASWVVETVMVDGQAQSASNSLAKPAVFADGSMYIVVPVSPPPGESGVTYAFLEGQDRTDGGVDFSAMLAPDDEPLLLTLVTHDLILGDRLPGLFSGAIDIEFAVDPNDPNRLYLTYFDVDTWEKITSPIHMYTIVLTRNGNYWTLGNPIQVDCCSGIDRFMATMTVDDRSRLHVLFYDDRQYVQSDNDPTPKYDLRYAFGEDSGSGLSFDDDPFDVGPALNFDRLGLIYDPREYMGIDNFAGEIWTAYLATFEPPPSCSSDADCDDLNPCSVDTCAGDTCDVSATATCLKSASLIRSRVIDVSERRYVSPVGNDSNAGESWDFAFATLGKALEEAANPSNGITEIRVAEGTYAPGVLGDRTATFALVNGVTVRGGYSLAFTPPVRDHEAYPTILSGQFPSCATDSDCPGLGNLCMNGICDLEQGPGNRPYHVVTADGVGGTTTLDGFVIEHGNANGTGDDENGAGLWMQNSKPLIRNCVFRDNWALSGGGGISVSGGAPSILGCVFRWNDAQFGGALHIVNGSQTIVLDSLFVQNTGSAPHSEGGAIMANDAGTSVRVARCTFQVNVVTGGGGAICAVGDSAMHVSNSKFLSNWSSGAGGAIYNDAASAVVSNSWLAGNTAQASGGGAVFSLSDLTMSNCTVSQNHGISYTGFGGAVWSNGPINLTISNTVLWGNTSGLDTGLDAQISLTSNAVANVSYSCVQDDTPGTAPFPFPGGIGNIDLDPLLLVSNHHLDRFSPCIDAGNNDADIDASMAGVQPIGNRDADEAPRFANDRTVIDNGAGTPPIVDMGAFESPLVPIFVDVAAPCEPNCDGDTWATAYTDLQDALAQALTGDEIWVAAGTYTPTTCSPGSCGTIDRQESFELIDGVSLLGGFDGTEQARDERNFGVNDSILSGDLDGDDTAVACMDDSPDCDDFGGACVNNSCLIGSDNNDENSYHVVSASGVNNSAVLDGFVIQAGNADGVGDDGRGGGALVSNANPTIRHCRFLGNSASINGGAAYHLGAGPVVYSGTYVNCLFSGNRSASSNGGALYSNVASAIQLLNCTIAGNQATSGLGGGVRAGFGFGVITLTNCVLWGNRDSGDSEQDAQLSFDTGFPSGQPPMMTYSVIRNDAMDVLWPGTDNTDGDPKFMDPDGDDDILGTLDDDLRITVGSSAFGIGLNSVILPLTVVDLAGNPRLSGAGVDSGAYELENVATGFPFLDEDPNFVPKNRYISFQPGQVEAALLVTLTDSNLFPDLIGQTWWVDSPHPSIPDLFSLGCNMVFTDWSQHPVVINVGDEQIFPDSTYTVHAVFDGGVAGTFPITVITVAPWCDIVGAADGQGGWTPPNGLVNFNDINALVFAFQGNPAAPPLPRSDVDPAVPNATANLADVFQASNAFQGYPYPFAEPSPCP